MTNGYKVGLDDNHKIMRDFMLQTCGGGVSVKLDGKKSASPCYVANYKGYELILRDTSRSGEFVTDGDIQCPETGKMLLLEVKTPEAYASKNHGMKAGQLWLFENVNNMRIIVTDEDMIRVADELIREELTP